MKKNKEVKRSKYTDLATVESHRNELTAEEFPEGPYGASLPVETLGKSSPWRIDQRSPNPYTYENKELHHKLPRGYPFADSIIDLEQDGEFAAQSDEFSEED